MRAGVAPILACPVAEAWRQEYLVEALQVFFKHRYFLIEIERFDPRPTALLGNESDWLQEFRWWDLRELLESDLTVDPADLGARVRELVQFGTPHKPIALSAAAR